MSTLFSLKVSCDLETYRTILIPGTASLYKLAETITKYYGFFFDHAFGFYNNIDNYYESTEVYTIFADSTDGFGDPDRKEKSVRKTKVNQVFKKDKEMLFLFDYGDEWLFHILCLDDEVAREPRKRYPKLIDQKGEAPEQYPDYDEEDYDDDYDEEE
ncbi:hypothetical protein [Moorena sp. SIO2C4]|uniref:IS1096 element passenger TnpR family protein n=1 Tax=Moorena sp. SIO2C4 TaxID=2607824 RepID=UPI0013C892E8|nr:hypothetical protein [Moorena sp. SIO2C4]NES44642.1 plasmid pRiA4b ORF-3 family protein [Moorena sp. SIO2C4]